MQLPGGITLRDHQVRTIEAVKAAYRGGARRILVVMPTGAGKTKTACGMIWSALGKGRRVLWITHTRDLVEQSAASIIEICGEHTVGFVMAGKAANPKAPIQVASVQTIAARGLVPPADVLVLDEAHHAVASTWSALLACYPNVELIIGLTATPERSDRTPLGHVQATAIAPAKEGFDTLISETSIVELMRTCVACGCKFNTVCATKECKYVGRSNPTLVPCTVIGPREARKELSKTVLEAVQQSAGTPSACKSTIVFCGTVKEAYEQTDVLKRAGYRAACVEGASDPLERKAAIARHREGRLDVLVNVQALTEGFDSARTEVVILARGCTSSSTFLQIVGRGLRPCPETGKTQCILEDLRGQVWLHGLPDEKRIYSLTGRGISREQKVSLTQCRSCGGVWKSGTPRCESCGAPLVQPRPKVVVSATETAAITSVATVAERSAVYAQLLSACLAKGNNPKQAGVLFKWKYGYWPRSKEMGL